MFYIVIFFKIVCILGVTTLWNEFFLKKILSLLTTANESCQPNLIPFTFLKENQDNILISLKTLYWFLAFITIFFLIIT